MLIRIKPIIRDIVEPDRLVDVIDVDGVQTAIIVRSFDTLEEAKAFDGAIIDEDFDVQDFLDERIETNRLNDIQVAKDKAQKYLSDTDYVVIKMAEGVALEGEYTSILVKRAEARVALQ